MVIIWTDLPASHPGADRIPGNTMMAAAAGGKNNTPMHKDIIRLNSAFIFLSEEGEGVATSGRSFAKERYRELKIGVLLEGFEPG